ncbi:hypothetical protein VB716_11310 [Synechococcus sp. CCY9201]|uniref:hypothetical protein n=1 Tax=Synechococcus sp. CCY9201 TaxID=174697 RepID=UPI002B204CCC|nr:hypothetical protein [Synechococcus sp. CCY9201]MEA5474809.1 hypothetical protein [Synechococcus sp. CCY9201]
MLLLNDLQEWSATGASQGRRLVVTMVVLQDGPVYGWSGELDRRSSPTKVLILMETAHRATVKIAADAGIHALLLLHHNSGQGAQLENPQSQNEVDQDLPGQETSRTPHLGTGKHDFSVSLRDPQSPSTHRTSLSCS